MSKKQKKNKQQDDIVTRWNESFHNPVKRNRVQCEHPAHARVMCDSCKRQMCSICGEVMKNG